MNKVAIITGASSGFGYLATIELAKEQFQVIATMRDLSKKEPLLKVLSQLGLQEFVHFQSLDVTNEQSLQEFTTFLSTLGRIDVLVNNAGFALGGFAEEVSLHEYKKQFDTNFFGLIAVTQAVLPYMRKQRQGKIINISSISGHIGFPGLSPYVSSKFALEGYSESLRLEVRPFGVEVALIEPGSYKTNIWSSGKQIAHKSLDPNSPYRHMMMKIENQLELGQNQYGEPQEVAELIRSIACKKQGETKLRYPIGKGVRVGLLLKKLLPWKLWERVVMKKLS
ncbi:SDR family oxidoreductase [Cytobacillus suaedae]|nr:SDR family oxidoreductase [Cytobacillus suaedae]